MKQWKTAVRAGVALAMVTLVLLPLSGCKGGVAGLIAKFHHRKSHSRENTTDYAGNVQAVVSSPRLAIMKWSNYSDYQPQVQQFYDGRNDELAWTRDGKPTPEAMQLIQLFDNADQKGLRPRDYDAARWQQRLQKIATIQRTNDTSDNAQDNVAQFDAAMTISAMRYISDLHLGRINPQSLNFDIDVPSRRAAFDLAGFVDGQVVDANDVASAIATVEPQNAMYAATEKALSGYLMLAKEQDAGQPQPLPGVTKAVAPGGEYAGVGALLARLQFEGYTSLPQTPRHYDEELAAAVTVYQQRHGLKADGKLTQATIDSLNVPMDVRVQQISDSLERWRWLPENFINPRVFVNLPEFAVRTYAPDHSQVFRMEVVDGEADGQHDTPMFVRTMRYMIFRPYWNLPTDIVKKDLLGHVAKEGTGYLARNDYEVTDAAGKPVEGWTVDDLEHGRYRVRQKPGPKNALGLVKFMFPNEYDIYMHSTPEMNLFNLTDRDKSHGCVRLHDAEKMADWVLNGQGDWDADKIHDAMYGGDENNDKTVGLKTTLPVLIGYFTAIVGEDGSVDFFNDWYGYDKQLQTAIEQGMPYEQATVKINPKLAPGDTE